MVSVSESELELVWGQVWGVVWGWVSGLGSVSGSEERAGSAC